MEKIDETKVGSLKKLTKLANLLLDGLRLWSANLLINSLRAAVCLSLKNKEKTQTTKTGNESGKFTWTLQKSKGLIEYYELLYAPPHKNKLKNPYII